MRYFFIINRYSHSGRSGKRAEKLMELIRQKGLDAAFNFTESFDDAYYLSRRANLEGWDAVVAVGGDGTINKTLNGFYDEDGNRISNASLGIVYTGTSPDFCKSYDIPLEGEAAIDTLSRMNIRKIPIGRIEYRIGNEYDSNASKKTGYFACCANIGLGASLARAANSGSRKRMGDFLGTFTSLISILPRYKPSTYEALIDGEPIKLENTLNISVGITKYIASGIKLADAQNGGEDFYMLVARKFRAIDFPSFLRKIYSGKRFENTGYLALSRCRSFEITGEGVEGETEFDGDPAGVLPCRITMAKDKLDLICN